MFLSGPTIDAQTCLIRRTAAAWLIQHAGLGGIHNKTTVIVSNTPQPLLCLGSPSSLPLSTPGPRTSHQQTSKSSSFSPSSPSSPSSLVPLFQKPASEQHPSPDHATPPFSSASTDTSTSPPTRGWCMNGGRRNMGPHTSFPGVLGPRGW